MLRTAWKTDVDLLLDVTKDGNPEDLTQKSVTVYGIAYKSMNRGDVYKCILPIQKSGNSVLIHFTSEYQKYPGVYSLFLVVNEGMPNSMSAVVQNAVYFYYSDFYSDSPILLDLNITDPDIYQLSANIISLSGKSAYEIAVSNGFVGNESEWLQSLQGKSLYEIYVDKGLFSGTEDQFLLWYRDQLRQDISDLSTISSSDQTIVDYEGMPEGSSVSTLQTIKHVISDVTEIKDTLSQIEIISKLNYYKTSNLTGTSGTILATTHKCGTLPTVQSYLDGEQVFCDITLNSLGDVTWNTSSVMTEESKFVLVITGI